MRKVFISHSSSDKLVAKALSDLLRLGAGLDRTEIFFSSGTPSSRVKSGQRFNATIRENVADAELIVAVVSPNFQASAFCLAELGFAWAGAKEDGFFPILLPGMDRSALGGVLDGFHVGFLDERAILDELHDRVTEGRPRDTGEWNARVEEFLAMLEALLAKLPVPQTASLEELSQLTTERDAARQALKSTKTTLLELEAKYDELKAAKTTEEIQAAVAPTTDVEWFGELLIVAQEKAKSLPNRWVATAIFTVLSTGQGMAWQRDEWEFDKAVTDGYLIELDGLYEPDTEFPEIGEASEAVDELASMLRNAKPDFEAWFKQKYGVPPKLSAKAVWDELIGIG